jgi:hypothetical protein
MSPHAGWNAPISRSSRGYDDVAPRHLHPLPPVELGDALGRDAPRLEVRADPERADERNIGSREHPQRRVVQMVVVVVRKQHDVHRRHRREGHGHRLEAARAHPPRRRRALTPDRVGEDACSVDLEQDGRVPEHGGA